MKTRFLVYKVPSRGCEYFCIAGVFYGFSVPPERSVSLHNWQQDFQKIYIPSKFKSVNDLLAYYGHSKVQKVIRFGVSSKKPRKQKN